MEQIVKETSGFVVNADQVQVEVVQQKAVISELHAFELALVGGGSAVVAF